MVPKLRNCWDYKEFYKFNFNFNFNFIYYVYLTKGHFLQIALASRGGKQQKREGFHNSLSNLNKIKENKINENKMKGSH